MLQHPDEQKEPVPTKRGNVSATMRAAIWQAHSRRCAYTGEQVSLADVEIDHIIPIATSQIATSQEDLDRLVTTKIIPPGFELNSLGNLLPKTRFQNSRKRANVRRETHFRHFLEVAEQYRPAAEAYLRVSLDESRVLNAYLQLKAQAERNDLQVGDIIDIKRQQAEGLTRRRHKPELVDAGAETLLNAELARALMTKPFALGLWRHR
jgi:5-methylcytosine-specific restriction endonuclease McrA